MTYPIRNLKETLNRLDQYQLEDRPLNIEESRQVRDHLQLLLLAADPVIRFAKAQRLPPNVSLSLQNLERVIG